MSDVLDTASSIAENFRTSGRTPRAEDGGPGEADEADDDMALMLEEFCIYDTAVVRSSDAVSDSDALAMSKVMESVDVGESASFIGASGEALRKLFEPPPDVVPVRIRPRTGSLMRPGDADYAAPTPADMHEVQVAQDEATGDGRGVGRGKGMSG